MPVLDLGPQAARRRFNRETQMTKSYIKDGREYAIWQSAEGADYVLRSRPINPKTNRPWQAGKILGRWAATEKAQAMRAWLYAHKRA